MTPKEFKAWFEGFTEAFDRLPTKTQWARVKERVAEIDGRETTERVYVDRYINRYWPPYPYLSNLSGHGIFGNAQTISGNAQGLAGQYQGALNSLGQSGNQFSSLNAMGSLGRAEAQLLTQKTGDHHG